MVLEKCANNTREGLFNYLSIPPKPKPEIQEVKKISEKTQKRQTLIFALDWF